jgi:hypothetical protein
MVRELLLIALAAGAMACSKAEKSPEGAGASTVGASGVSGKADVPSGAARTEPPLAGKDFYRIDTAPLAECKAGTSCQVELRLTALGDYKVNKDYPFKFLAEEQPGISVDGTGSFAHQGKQSGAMTVKFQVDTAGTAQLAGTFKLSVCTEATCEIDEPQIAFSIPVK